MQMRAVVLEQDDYDAWIQEQLTAATIPTDPAAKRDMTFLEDIALAAMW